MKYSVVLNDFNGINELFICQLFFTIYKLLVEILQNCKCYWLSQLILGYKFLQFKLLSQGQENVQSDRGSNLGLLAYRLSALPNELSGCLTHYLPNSD